MAAIKANWQQMKKDCIEQHGTADHLPLPDIIITHEMSYDAPAGKATADRAMPLPRSMVSDSQQTEIWILRYGRSTSTTGLHRI